MNVRQIEVFKAVMECHTTTAAAALLNISQPTVSEHLHALERATTLTLFDRNKNRLVPTPAADAFYAEISRLYLGVEHLERFVDGLKNEFLGQIDFGCMPMASYKWIPQVLARFLQQQPVGSINMPVRSSKQILEWVAAGRLDFGIVFSVRGYPQVEIEDLLRIPLVCLFPKESGLSARELIRPDDLDGKTIIQLRSFDLWTVSLEQVLQRHGQIKPKNLIETFVTQTAAQLAITCRGYALVDMMTAIEMADDSMDWRPFEGGEAFEIHLAYSSNKQRSKPVEVLMDLIREDAQIKSLELRIDVAN